MKADELARWLVDNGCAEEQRGYGHIAGDELADRLLASFIVIPKLHPDRDLRRQVLGDHQPSPEHREACG